MNDFLRIFSFKDWWSKKSKLNKGLLIATFTPLIVANLIAWPILGWFQLNKEEARSPIVQGSVPYDNFLNNFKEIEIDPINGCWDMELLEYDKNSLYICFNSDSTIEWGTKEKIIFYGNWYTVKDSLYFTLWVEKYQGRYEFVGDILNLYFIETTWQKTLNTMSGTRSYRICRSEYLEYLL